MDKFTFAIYFLHAQVLRDLGHPRRLMILDHLHSGEKSVGELVEFLGLPQGKVSRHLKDLREQGIVTARRNGNTVFYSLADSRIVLACDLLHDFLADRMKDNRVFASHFARLRQLRAIKPASDVKKTVEEIQIEGTHGLTN